jgi:preprotein translocase subunit SecA
MLHTIDEGWKENLRELDELRQSVQNASYEQKDPLLIYKLESFGLFESMMNSINRKMVSVLMRGHIPVQDPSAVKESAPERRQDYSKYRTRKDDLTETGTRQGPPTEPRVQRVEPVKVGPKIGRNDPCPCGSGKKYKNCHGNVS